MHVTNPFDRRIEIIVGLPHLSDGPILRRAKSLAIPVLLSANSLSRWRDQDGAKRWTGWQTNPLKNAKGLPSIDLDSAGYTMMSLYRGFPWSIRAYMNLAASYPFRRVASADYCCEVEIAADRDEVLDRIARTIQTNRICQHIAQDLGISGRLMPVLQGRYPSDYEKCADALSQFIVPGAVIGIGSMCRRAIHGPEGLIAVIEHLDRKLPNSVRLHAFGVKGSALPWLKAFSPRIASIDSQAWALQARHRAYRAGISKTDQFCADEMERWLARQHETLNREECRQGAHVTHPEDNSGQPEDPWQMALAEARIQIRGLIENGDLSHDEVTSGWTEQWAADLLHNRRNAA